MSRSLDCFVLLGWLGFVCLFFPHRHVRLAGDDDDIYFSIYCLNLLYYCCYYYYYCEYGYTAQRLFNSGSGSGFVRCRDHYLSFLQRNGYQFLRLFGWEWKLRKRVGEGGGGRCKVDASCILLSLITLYMHSSVFNNAEHAFFSL